MSPSINAMGRQCLTAACPGTVSRRGTYSGSSLAWLASEQEMAHKDAFTRQGSPTH